MSMNKINKKKIVLFLILFILTIFFLREGSNILLWFLNLIEWVEDKLKVTMGTIKNDLSLCSLFVFWLVAFIYGFLHAAGPGHGKTVVTAYFLTEKHGYYDSFLMALSLALTHISISVILSYLFVMVISSVAPIFELQIQLYFKAISGTALVLVALILLWKKLFCLKKHSCSQENTSHSNPLVFGFLTGLVPCPAVIFIMTFSLSAGMPLVGLFAVSGLMFGVFSLICLVSVITIRGREGLQLCIERNHMKGLELASIVLEYLSIITIIVVGALLLFSSFR